MRSPVQIIQLHIDDVVHLDVSYRRRPTRVQARVYAIRERFGRKRPASSPKHLIDWERDAITELKECGFTVRTPTFAEEDSPDSAGVSRRSVCAERDGSRYILFYDIQ